MRREFSWRDYDKFEEWLQDVLETMVEDLKNKDKEIERLQSIIKEVREYIEEMQVWDYEYNDFVVLTKGALEILDKE